MNRRYLIRHRSRLRNFGFLLGISCRDGNGSLPFVIIAMTTYTVVRYCPLLVGFKARPKTLSPQQTQSRTCCADETRVKTPRVQITHVIMIFIQLNRLSAIKFTDVSYNIRVC